MVQERKIVTKTEWQVAVRHGYAGLDFQKTPYMLYLDDNGATIWGPVTISDQLTQNLAAEPMYPEAI